MSLENTSAPTAGTLGAAVEANQVVQEAVQEAIQESADATNTTDSADSADAADSAEPAEPADTADSAESEEEHETKKKSGFERRVAKLNTKLSAKEQEIAYWKAQALNTNKQEPVNVQPVNTEKPKFENYNTLEEYTTAMVMHELNMRDAQSNQVKMQQQQKQAVDTYSSRANEFAKNNPDFQEVLDDASDIEVALEITQAIIESELGPQIAYYLGNNTDEIARLNSLSPQRRLIELGKIEDRLTKPVAKKAPPKPAPIPVRPVSGPASIGTKAPEEMSSAEYIAYRNKITNYR